MIWFSKNILKQLCCLIFLWKLWLYIFWTYYGDAFVTLLSLLLSSHRPPAAQQNPVVPVQPRQQRDCHEQTATLLSHSLRPTRRPLQRPSEQEERMVVRTLWWPWIARQMELHPDKQPILLVAGLIHFHCHLFLSFGDVSSLPLPHFNFSQHYICSWEKLLVSVNCFW